MGVISPVGNDVNTFWSNLCDGVCGIDYIKSFPTDNLPVGIAGIIKDFKAEEYGMDKPFIRKQDLFTQYGVAAAYQAMRQSGLSSKGEDKNIDPFRLGVYFGSGIGGFATQYREVSKMIEDPSGQWISPLFIPTMISNIAAGHIAILHNAQGPCLDIVTACATSTNAMGEAFRAIRNGYADAIITGAAKTPPFRSASSVSPTPRPSPEPRIRITPHFLSTATVPALSWRTAPQRLCLRNMNTPRPVERRLSARWSATATPATLPLNSSEAGRHHTGKVYRTRP